MIRVLAIYQKGKLVSFEVKGHAGSGEEGHDLVCAAISGIVPGAFNAFLQEYDIEVLSGYVKLVAPSSGLQAHDETSVWNLPYEKFEMNAATLNANKEEPDYYRDRYYEFPSYKYRLIFSNSYNWQTYNNTAGNPCPDGYRMPNLRELLIMSTRLPKNEWPEYVIEAEGLGYARPEVRSKAMYISKTGFSMCGIDPYTGERRGFIYDAQSDKIFLQNNDGERGYLRCVRDTD